MKKIFTLFFALVYFYGFSQVQEYGTPQTLEHNLSISEIPDLRYTKPDLDQLQAEDAINDVEKGRQRIATMVSLGVDFFEEASKVELDDVFVYQLKISTHEAEALSLFYDEFYLETNDKFFVFNEDGSEIQGSFSSINNSSTFGTGLIGGEYIILEYSTKRATPKARISIKELGYAYRHTGKSKKRDFGDADDCQVNINCSEGNNFEDQRDAVVRILITDNGSQFWCSGTLINNVRQDCTPYLLTAVHCGENATPNDISQWIFYFNYQAPNCNNPSSEGTLAAQFLTGATKRAASNDSGGNTGSDFMLIEITNSIPANYNAYFAGWDANNTTVTGGVNIHHPDGDIKKISTFSGTANSTSWGGTVLNTHWGVLWTATTNGHGVTEQGSSGSALFNNDKRIIGTLTGGSAFCTNTNGQDEYGKMSYHWTSNGASNSNQLKPWLDPDNTNTTILDGIAHPCNTSTGEPAEDYSLKLFPNPVQQLLTIEWDQTVLTSDIRVLDITGREVTRQYDFGNGEMLDLTGFTNGMYLIELDIHGTLFTRKIVVQK